MTLDYVGVLDLFFNLSVRNKGLLVNLRTFLARISYLYRNYFIYINELLLVYKFFHLNTCENFPYPTSSS
jgi:hypothetical protein